MSAEDDRRGRVGDPPGSELDNQPRSHQNTMGRPKEPLPSVRWYNGDTSEPRPGHPPTRTSRRWHRAGLQGGREFTAGNSCSGRRRRICSWSLREVAESEHARGCWMACGVDPVIHADRPNAAARNVLLERNVVDDRRYPTCSEGQRGPATVLAACGAVRSSRTSSAWTLNGSERDRARFRLDQPAPPDHDPRARAPSFGSEQCAARDHVLRGATGPARSQGQRPCKLPIALAPRHFGLAGELHGYTRDIPSGSHRTLLVGRYRPQLARQEHGLGILCQDKQPTHQVAVIAASDSPG